MRLALLALLALAACNEPSPQQAPATSATADPAMKSAAEKECAELTGNTPARLETMSSEMRTMVGRDYNLCVARVMDGDPPPELRGRDPS